MIVLGILGGIGLARGWGVVSVGMIVKPVLAILTGTRRTFPLGVLSLGLAQRVVAIGGNRRCRRDLPRLAGDIADPYG